MKEYTVRYNRAQQTRQIVSFKGAAETIKYDFAPWEEDNGSVTSVTWSTESGQASVSNENLSSSIASALITTNEQGKSLIKLTATAGNNKHVTYLHVMSKDPKNTYNDIAYYH